MALLLLQIEVSAGPKLNDALRATDPARTMRIDLEQVGPRH